MTKILLVEDNELNRDMLSRRLRRRGYEVVLAVDGAGALVIAQAQAQIQAFDLILMDMSLPVMDGWEATRRLKANPKTQSIPVIALTAHAMVGDRERSLAAGCDDYDTKPIDLKRLLGKVKAFLIDESATESLRPKEQPAAELVAPQTSEEFSPSHQALGHRIPPKILVVDDNADNRDLLTRRLQRRGYHAPHADSGEAALQILQEQSDIALVLLDIMMPGMDGIETLRQIRQRHSRFQLPVVMVTAKSQSDDMVQAFEQGANDYITKPLDFDVALARIESHLATVQKRFTAETSNLETSHSAFAERYQIESTLSQEPLGPVAIARVLPTQELVVLQTFDIPSSTLFPIFSAALAEVSEQLAPLRDQFPNLSSGQIDQTLYISHGLGPDNRSDYLLQAQLKEDQSWSLNSVLDLMSCVLKQIEPFHQQNQVHGGLNNRCFIRRNGHLQLIDSGLGKRVLMKVSQQSAEYRKRLLMQRNLPMEQRIGRPVLSSDLYAIGLIGLQALTGLPIAQLAASPSSARGKWQQKTSTPKTVMDWFESLVSSNPTERYPQAMAARAALQSLQSELPVSEALSH